MREQRDPGRRPPTIDDVAYRLFTNMPDLSENKTRLSESQRQVFELALHGLSESEIALALGTTEKRVQGHLREIRQKEYLA